MSSLSIPSAVAVALYCGVVLACIAAAAIGRLSRKPRSDIFIWLALAAVFAVMIGLRIWSLEDAIRVGLREIFQAQGAYDLRQSFQIIALTLIVALGALSGSRLFFRIFGGQSTGTSRFLAIAMAAACMMLLLVGVRIVSLHVTDALLYGALKLNWIVDAGTAAVTLFCATRYIGIARRLSRDRSRAN